MEQSTGTEIEVGHFDDILTKMAVKYEIREEQILTNKKLKSIWHMRIDEDFDVSSAYRRHFDILRKAREGDEIILYISSYGGYLDTAVQFIYALLDTKAATTSVIYVAASAATLVAFACDKVVVKPISTIMLHNFSVAQQGKGAELRAKTDFDDRIFAAMCTMLYKGIVTDAEIKELQLDRDFWWLGRELLERMEKYNWRPLREREEYGEV